MIKKNSAIRIMAIFIEDDMLMYVNYVIILGFKKVAERELDEEERL